MHLSDYIQAAVGLVFVIIGGLGMGWFKIIKETNNLLKDQNKELKEENSNYKEKHEENVRAISSMQGQIDILKSIPLVNIDTTLKNIASFNKSIVETNKKILDTLQKSATELKSDTEKAAAAVKHVKDDLKETGV